MSSLYRYKCSLLDTYFMFVLTLIHGLITQVWGYIVLTVRNKILKTQDPRGSSEIKRRGQKIGGSNSEYLWNNNDSYKSKLLM